jgi:hypothetical protein
MSFEPVVHTYEDVPVSPLSFDATAGWAAIPRALLCDWLEVVARVARVIAPEYAKPDLPDAIAFKCETISSDGPYGSSENFYYLNDYSFEVEGLSIRFESGRQEGGEPLAMETRGLKLDVSSYLFPRPDGAAKARFFVWHRPDQAADVKRALGLA